MPFPPRCMWRWRRKRPDTCLVVVGGQTGLLVPYDAAEPRAFEHAFADAVNDLATDPARASAMGIAGRARAVSDFGWDAIADQTIAVYDAALRA